MTEAGERLLVRETVVTHKATGVTVRVDNRGAPVQFHAPSHKAQRDQALKIMEVKLGHPVDRDECNYEFLIHEERTYE